MAQSPAVPDPLTPLHKISNKKRGKRNVSIKIIVSSEEYND